MKTLTQTAMSNSIILEDVPFAYQRLEEHLEEIGPVGKEFINVISFMFQDSTGMSVLLQFQKENDRFILQNDVEI